MRAFARSPPRAPEPSGSTHQVHIVEEFRKLGSSPHSRNQRREPVFKGSRVFWPSTLVAALTCLIVVPATASAATTLWVAAKAPSAPFNSCEHPGYSHIEAALGGPGTAIHVCEGTYAEQLTIERPGAISGYGKVTLELPAVTANSATPCDKASEEWFGLPEQDAISICGTAKVSIRNLNVDAVWPGEPAGGSGSLTPPRTPSVPAPPSSAATRSPVTRRTGSRSKVPARLRRYRRPPSRARGRWRRSRRTASACSSARRRQ